MLDKISYNEGNQLESLTYHQLTKLENNLLTLLLKIKGKISEFEMDIINGEEEFQERRFCIECKLNEINVVFKPCSHICLCVECAESALKCPICLEYVEYFEKVYLTKM